jgi:hypothetical protein
MREAIPGLKTRAQNGYLFLAGEQEEAADQDARALRHYQEVEREEEEGARFILTPLRSLLEPLKAL